MLDDKQLAHICATVAREDPPRHEVMKLRALAQRVGDTGLELQSDISAAISRVEVSGAVFVGGARELAKRWRAEADRIEQKPQGHNPAEREAYRTCAAELERLVFAYVGPAHA